jgi:hypothetical protein
VSAIWVRPWAVRRRFVRFVRLDLRALACFERAWIFVNVYGRSFSTFSSACHRLLKGDFQIKRLPGLAPASHPPPATTHPPRRYDGTFFAKPPEVLARDRLLGAYEARPALARLRATLTAAGAALAAALLALSALTATGGAAGGGAGGPVPAQVFTDGVLYSRSVGSMAELATDDEAAEREAAAQGGRPGWCGTRYHKALAGGEDVCARYEAAGEAARAAEGSE